MESISLIRTLVIPLEQDRILLGLKKRGFGKGKWNGFGGKVEEGETIRQAARRELHEESGLRSTDVEACGTLAFTFGNGISPLFVYVFRTYSWTGGAAESEEMKPRWFSQSAIPYRHMWIDDQHWLPLVLAQKYFTGTFALADVDTIRTWEVNEVAAEAFLGHV